MRTPRRPRRPALPRAARPSLPRPPRPALRRPHVGLPALRRPHLSLHVPRPHLPRPHLPRPHLGLPRPGAVQLIGVTALAVLATGGVTAVTHDQDRAAPTAYGSEMVPLAPVPDTLVFQSDPLPVPDVQVTAEAGSPPATVTPVLTLGPLTRRTDPDVVVTIDRQLSPSTVKRISSLAKGGSALPFRSGRIAVAGRAVPAAGVDPATFRRFAAKGTAEATAVWQAIASGEAVVSHLAAKRLGLVLGDTIDLVPLGGGTPVPVRLGALATTGIPSTDVLVDDALSDALGLPQASGIVLASGDGSDPIKLANAVREITGGLAVVDLLSQPVGNPTAFLTGGDAARAFGAFSYRYFSDGSIAPDEAWVRDNIRTETVPIVGTVTCHKLMLPQLRGALEEVVARGYGDKLTVHNGCYVPRFIGSDPGRPISLHTWGIAIDFDAATNYRGIRGTMDMNVVNIFKRWGFRWGGDWSYTDPMHFEMGAILTDPS